MSTRSTRTTRTLLAVHRWCGLVVSINFVVLALTGLILVFHDEIDAALGVTRPVAAEGATISFARAIDVARATKPDATATYVFQKPDAYPGVAFIGLAEGSSRLRDSRSVAVDLHGGGRVIEKLDLEDSFTVIVLKIHAELFAGLPGRLFLGVVAIAIVVSLVTGAFVYGPTMRRFSFGALRRGQSRRILLADLHKLLGAAAFGWNLVVASTGVLLAFATLIFQLYATTELASMGAPYASEPTVTDLATVDAAIASSARAAPDRQWSTVALPGSDFASPRHYTVLLRGGTGIEAHMLTVAMVDALHPSRAERKELPLYMKALLLCEPLHFGNYGGVPLKIVWALFTVVTLVLSVTGVWVFFAGRKRRGTREAKHAGELGPAPMLDGAPPRVTL